MKVSHQHDHGMVGRAENHMNLLRMTVRQATVDQIAGSIRIKSVENQVAF